MKPHVREMPDEFYDCYYPARPGLYPSVLLGDGQWDRIVIALRQRGTKADDALAARVEKSVQSPRRRNPGR